MKSKEVTLNVEDAEALVAAVEQAKAKTDRSLGLGSRGATEASAARAKALSAGSLLEVLGGGGAARRRLGAGAADEPRARRVPACWPGALRHILHVPASAGACSWARGASFQILKRDSRFGDSEVTLSGITMRTCAFGPSSFEKDPKCSTDLQPF